MATVRYTLGGNYNPANNAQATDGGLSIPDINTRGDVSLDGFGSSMTYYNTVDEFYTASCSLATSNGMLTLTHNNAGYYFDFSDMNTAVLEGGRFGDVIRGTSNADIIAGHQGDDILEGGSGTDDIDGGDGIDTLSYAHSANFVVASLATGRGGGYGDADFDIISNIENLAGSVGGDTLTGDAGANTLSGVGGSDRLYGGGGNDTLDGGLGGDEMAGGAANDSYLVDNAGDTVFEVASGGTDDRVYVTGNVTFTSYALAAGQEIEVLATSRSVSTRPLDLTGNDKGQAVYGNAGANVLDGKGGTDTLEGYAGADTFAFSSALGADNVDRILDFASADDTIRLSKSVFAALDLGGLSASAFKDLGVAGAQIEADDRILYDGKGRLFYDADGAGGSDAVLFAKLSYVPSLTHDDFLVV